MATQNPHCTMCEERPEAKSNLRCKEQLKCKEQPEATSNSTWNDKEHPGLHGRQVCMATSAWHEPECMASRIVPEPSMRMKRAQEELPMALSASCTHDTAHTHTHTRNLCSGDLRHRPHRLGGMLVYGLQAAGYRVESPKCRTLVGPLQCV